MAKRIPISFKDTERDLKLYEHIDKQGSKSNFVKDAVQFYIEHKYSKDFNTVINEKNKSDLDSEIDRSEILDILG